MAAVDREVLALRREIERQDRMAVFWHGRACACWVGIAQLQAEVIRHQLEMREGKSDDTACECR